MVLFFTKPVFQQERQVVGVQKLSVKALRNAKIIFFETPKQTQEPLCIGKSQSKNHPGVKNTLKFHPNRKTTLNPHSHRERHQNFEDPHWVFLSLTL